MACIEFEIDTKVQRYVLLVAAADRRFIEVPVTDGRARAELPPGRHRLVWSIIGSGGAPFNVVGRHGSDSVLEVRDCRIPRGEISGAGSKRFTVPDLAPA